MKNLKIDLRLSLYLYIKNLIKRAPSIAVLALTLIVLIYGSASPTTALPVLPDATLTAAATAQPAPQSLNTWSSHGPWGGYKQSSDSPKQSRHPICLVGKQCLPEHGW
jgi:hypothetical protein